MSTTQALSTAATPTVLSMANGTGHLIVLAEDTDQGARFVLTLIDACGAECRDVTFDGADLGALCQFAFEFLADRLGAAAAVQAVLEGAL